MVGPGGAVTLGYGAGTAEEGITIEQDEDKDTMVVAADGTPMHSLHAGRNGSVTIRLLKTSPSNALLQAMYDFQQLSSAAWGHNVIVVSQVVAGDITTCTSVAFKRMTPMTYGKEGGINEWAFNAGYIDRVLGVYLP